QALSAHAVALAAGPSGQLVTSFSEVAPVALMADSIDLLRAWVIETLGALADHDEHNPRLRGARGVRLHANRSHKATPERLELHTNHAQYRIRRGEERLGGPLGEDHLHLELALLASEWLGPAVLRQTGTPPP